MKIIYFILIMLLASCAQNLDIFDLKYADGTILSDTTEIADDEKSNFEGIYKINQANDQFGAEVALKWHDKKLYVYGAKLGTYFVLNAGTKDNLFYFEGSWRHMKNNDVGLIRLQTTAAQSILSGSYGFNDNPNQEKISLEYLRPFSTEAINSNLLIVAHRGGVRNTDYIGVSENSIAMIAKAEALGGNAIEIDIKLSKDNVAFLYHDSNINLRSVREAPMWGPIEGFTFPQLRTFIKLINGETIPTLKEALDYVLNKTQLKLVWLDMKSEKNAMNVVIPIQQDIMSQANTLGRDLTVVIGLPDEEKQKNFMQYTGYENIKSINEGEVEQVRESNSYAWGPRWTMGSQSEAVSSAHAEGKIIITWTVDQTKFIEKFINEGEFDGLVTNFPTIAAYYNYAK